MEHLSDIWKTASQQITFTLSFVENKNYHLPEKTWI